MLELLRAGGVAGEQGDEHLGVGAAPAGDRVPAGRGLVAGDRLGGNVTVLLPVVTSWKAWWYSGLRPMR